MTRLGNLLDFGKFLKTLATINWPKSPTFLGNLCKGIKIYHFSSEIIFGDFFLVTLKDMKACIWPSGKLLCL